MKIIITGITGLIGNHVMQVLLQNNYNDIRGTYFSNRNLEEYKQQGIEMRYADISNENSIKNITKDCAIVVHSAARVMDFGTKQQFYAAHYDATHYLLKDAKKNGVQHFIYVSSVGAASSIDRNKIIPDETVPVKKTGIHYDDVKIDTEILVRNFCTKNNLYYTIIRPTAVIGKGSVWVTEPLKRMDTKLGLKLIDHGKQPACLIDAENLANGIFLCMTKEAAHNQTFFFMDDWEVSWKQYFTDLGVMKGKKISNSIPFTLAFLLASIAEILFPLFGKNPKKKKKSAIATGTNRLVSTEKAKTLLGWTSKISYPTSMQRIKESLN